MHRPKASLLFMIAASVVAGCGGHGGGSSVDIGPMGWAVPFAGESARPTLVFLRNLDLDSTTVMLQGYKADGSLYPGPVSVDLDGWDEATLTMDDVIGTSASSGGFVYAWTVSRKVEVAFDVFAPAEDEGEASRAWPLPDLLAPPPSWDQA